MATETIRTTEFVAPDPGAGSAACAGSATQGVCISTKDCRSLSVEQRSIRWKTWAAPAHQADWTAATLKVAWILDAYTSTCTPVGTGRLRLQYSLDAGSTWLNFGGFPKDVSGVEQSGTATIAISVHQTLANLLVRAIVENEIDSSLYCPGHPPGDPENCAQVVGAGISDVYLVATYDTTPPDPVRGCCKPDDTCAMLTESACTAASGTWHSGWTSCSGHTCVAPGCCTKADGTCVADRTAAQCTALGGTWLGPGTSCTVAPDGHDCLTCTDIGDCCRPGEACVRSTQCWCEHAGGVFRGVGSVCSPSPCGHKTRLVLL